MNEWMGGQTDSRRHFDLQINKCFGMQDGLTALHCASRSGHEAVVDELLARGAYVGARTKSGLGALHVAAQGEHPDCARILLLHNAPVDDVTSV
jgi:ankyrin